MISVGDVLCGYVGWCCLCGDSGGVLVGDLGGVLVGDDVSAVLCANVGWCCSCW